MTEVRAWGSARSRSGPPAKGSTMESAARGFTRHRITVPHAGRRKGWTVDLIGGQVGGTVDAVKAGITTNAAKR